MMQFDHEFVAPPILSCDALALPEEKSIEQQVSDFLDGKTHGEELFHALYDHVLEEPIPERMGALFRAGGAD